MSRVSLLFIASLAAAGQNAPVRQQPVAPWTAQQPRDAAQRLSEPKGTSSIRGRVIAADTGSPIRRASVSLSPAPPLVSQTSANVPPAPQIRQRTATTDAQGVFEFTELPAGAYRVIASPGQYAGAYLTMAFGAAKTSAGGSSDPGELIELADGQTFDKASIVLPRGAVIAGRVVDENGQPLVRVQVSSILFVPGAARGSRVVNVQTDDLGQFRLFGLAPGEYVVAAEARPNTFQQPNARPESEEERVGLMTTYYPNTPDEASAQRVRARAGAESPGIEIQMSSGRLFRVSGLVSDSQGRPGARASGTIFKRGTGMVTSSFGFSTDEQGRFQMRNIPPGNYRLSVRQMVRNEGRGGDGQREMGEFASIAVSVNADVDNMVVMMSPGAAVAGNVVFENGPPQATGVQGSTTVRVSAQLGDPANMTGMPSPPPSIVAPDLTFTIKGLAGEMLLRANVQGQTLKAVTIGGEDITDTPREFKTGDRVTIVMTSRVSAVEGAVTDEAGRPTTDASLILFSDDKASWRSNSIRTRRGIVDRTGRYRLQSVLPGRYIIAALPRDRMNALGSLDEAAFEALAKEGTVLVVGEDEQRQVDVKVSAGGGRY